MFTWLLSLPSFEIVQSPFVLLRKEWDSHPELRGSQKWPKDIGLVHIEKKKRIYV